MNINNYKTILKNSIKVSTKIVISSLLISITPIIFRLFNLLTTTETFIFLIISIFPNTYYIMNLMKDIKKYNDLIGK